MTTRQTSKQFIPSIIVIVLVLSACKNDNETDCYEKDLRSVTFGFESTLEGWLALGGNGESANENDIQISTDVSFAGSQSVKFTVSPDSYVNSGIRAELTFDPHLEEGEEVNWEYRVLIPHDFQDVQLFDSNNEINWQLIGQWHDQPDECIGESWSTLPSQSPPIGIYYNYLSNSDPSYTSVINEAIQYQIYGMDSTWNNVSVLSLVYNNETVAMHEISKGEWIHLKFRTKWSTNNDGFIQGWINGIEFTDGLIYGKNMWNSASHYFKFGLYRKPTIPSTNTIYADDISIY